MRGVWRRLRGGELTAARAAASVAVGLAIGVTPLYGMHFFLVLAVCLPLRLDFPLSYLAANISIPLIAPFLTVAELEIGSFVLTGQALPMTLALVKAQGVSHLVKEMAVGTLVFSPAMGALGGAITFVLVRVVRGTPLRSDLDLALDRVATRYASKAHRAAYYYVRSKLAGDPIARRVAELGRAEPFGEVLDAGCGRGQLTLLVLEMKLASRVTGFDWDAKKVAAASSAAAGVPATFQTGDLREPLAESGDTSLLIDVLHYLTNEEQESVVRNVARATRHTLLVRELDPDRGWRSAVTRFQERITTGLGYNRGARVNVRPIATLLAVLEAEGFAADVTPCWEGTPFANVLIVARRRFPSPDPDQNQV